MARNDSDNFYRRQQEEANRIAAKQHRVLTDIAKLAKSSNEELRKFRKAFETFAEAILGMKIEPFQGAVLSEAARGQVAEFDIKGFKEALLNGEALVTPGGNPADDPAGKPAAVRVPEGKPYPSFNFKPDETKKRIAHVERTPRLGYGDVVAGNEDFIAHERESGKSEEEVSNLGLVIGVDLASDNPEEHLLIAPRAMLNERKETYSIVADEPETRELLLAVEAYAPNPGSGEEWPDTDQRAELVSRVRDMLNKPSTLEAAIENGEHPPTLDGMEDIDLPACGFCGDDIGAPGCPTHGEVLPQGVTPKMMADHPEFAERVRNSPHYHQMNQDASKRQREQERAIPITRHGHFFVPTEPGKDIPVTRNGEEIGRATINEDGTGTISIDGEKALQAGFASGGYTGVGLSENVMSGIVHQDIFSDAKRRRRDDLASY